MQIDLANLSPDVKAFLGDLSRASMPIEVIDQGKTVYRIALQAPLSDQELQSHMERLKSLVEECWEQNSDVTEESIGELVDQAVAKVRNSR